MASLNTGFWADHFTYLIDHIEAYLSIYPDWEERMLFDMRLPYFFSPASVKPRSRKYVLSLSYHGTGEHIRQLEATEQQDSSKIEYLSQFISNATGWYEIDANWYHTKNGDMFKSSPYEKLLVMGAVKFATRDAFGLGIEYEGGRPGWNDANNGLVGMLGSGMPETFELLVLLRFLLDTIAVHRRSIAVPVEAYEMIQAIEEALDDLIQIQTTEGHTHLDPDSGLDVPRSYFEYWDAVATAREEYREKTKLTFDGQTKEMSVDVVVPMLQRWISEIEEGIQRAMILGSRGDGDEGIFGIIPTYFSFNVTKWRRTGDHDSQGHALVEARSMRVNRFPLFLEGPVRMMKTVHGPAAFDIYEKVKHSPLRDSELNMYKISASLKGQSMDMGREMAFSPGWLENESVWVHMSYKFYLELLRQGFFESFFEEMRGGGMLPFMDPSEYKRPLMECSSFIASSAFEDPETRGRGFLARLSGSTAEYLSMWRLMMIGPQPFFVNPTTGQLRMQLLPALPRWLFYEEGDTPQIKFKLFSSIDVTYHHLRGNANLFRVPPSRYVVGLRDGSTFNVVGPSIPTELAEKIRRVVFVASIDVYFEP